MQNLLKDLIEALSANDTLVVDGKLLKNKVVELALNLDSTILKPLLNSESLKKHFFTDIDGVLVFDKIKFQKFVSNKEFLPDSYTSFKNKVGLTSGDEYIYESKDISLVWPYKDCLLEGGQSKDDTKRTEIFWNEILAPDEIDILLSPKVLTKFKKYDSNGVSDFNEISPEDSLLIKGNNLLSLHTLSKTHSNKVDVVYIDPPYNPESKSNTFCYNNSFNRSSWLTFIKNRLEITKKLLKTDGVLIVAIDENEQAHLGVLLKDMFPEHEVHCITIVHNPRGVQGTNFSYIHEYAFFVIPKGKKSIGYRQIEEEDVDWSPLRNWGGESERSDAKNCFYPVIIENDSIVGFGDVLDDDIHPSQTEKIGNQFYVYPIDKKGIERKWRYARQSVESISKYLRAKKTTNGYDIEIGKTFGLYKTVWSDTRYDANAYGTQIVKSLVPDCSFDFPKSLWNVYDCLNAVVGENKNAIVLDYFGGSGTTAHAVMELNKDGGNRKFILCEQMDYVEKVTVPRIQKACEQIKAQGFIYCELAKANQSFIDRIQDADKTDTLLTIWDEMQTKAFLSYKVNPKQFNESISEFSQLNIDEQKKFLIEVLDKNMLYVPLSEIDDETFGISEADKSINKKFFGNS